jgi:hypothetical protein
VLEHPFFAYLKEQDISSFSNFNFAIKAYFDGHKFSSAEDFMSFIALILALYTRENLTGPSVYTEYVDEVLRPLDSDAPLKETPLDFMSSKIEELQKSLLEFFNRDSELMYWKSQFLCLFYLAIKLLEEPTMAIPEELVSEELKMEIQLWQARTSFNHNIQLTSQVAHLKDSSLQFYETYIAYFRTNFYENEKEHLSMLLCEQSHCQLNFYQYQQA